MLSTASTARLITAGFTQAQVNAFNASSTFVSRIETFFSSNTGNTIVSTSETTQWNPKEKEIRINFSQITSTDEAIRLLAHEIGHATGNIQAQPISSYTSISDYNHARTQGEGEAVWLEYQIAKERGSTYISGGQARFAQFDAIAAETALNAKIGVRSCIATSSL